jgi:hypothetical protein
MIQSNFNTRNRHVDLPADGFGVKAVTLETVPRLTERYPNLLALKRRTTMDMPESTRTWFVSAHPRTIHQREMR